MPETKKFPLRVVLTVTTGRLLTASKGPRDNGIDDLYKILNWMTGDELFTHQLPRAGNECKPWLLRWFPELAFVEVALGNLDDTIKKMGAEKGVENWLGWIMEKGIKTEYDVPKIPTKDHKRINPLDELVGMVGADKVVVVETPE